MVEAQPVSVMLAGRHWDAAYYVQELETPEGTRAYATGERTYFRRSLYMLGSISEMPSKWRRNGRTVFDVVPTPDADRLMGSWVHAGWYVAGWYPHSEPNAHHPFGEMVQLMPDVPDDYGWHPRPRMRLEVTGQVG